MAPLCGQDPKPSEEEVRRVEEERIQVLNNMEELEQKIKELDNQMEESAREVRGYRSVCLIQSQKYGNRKNR